MIKDRVWCVNCQEWTELELVHDETGETIFLQATECCGGYDYIWPEEKAELDALENELDEMEYRHDYIS